MQMHDRGDQIEPQPHARRAPSPRSALEAPQHELSLGFGNARAIIAHLDDNLIRLAHHRQRHMAALAHKFQGVFNEIANHLQQQRLIAANGVAIAAMQRQANPRLLRQGLIELGNVGQQRHGIDQRKARLPARCLEFRYPQQGVEPAEDQINILYRCGDSRPYRLCGPMIARLCQRLQPVAQMRQRCAQIMRDGIRCPFHLLHQPLDLIEHRVDHARDQVQLVAARGHWHAQAQIARSNAQRHTSHFGHTAQRAQTEREARQQGCYNHANAAVNHGGENAAAQIDDRDDIARHLDPRPIRSPRHQRAQWHRRALPGRQFDRHPGARYRLRHEIARHHPTIRINQRVIVEPAGPIGDQRAHRLGQLRARHARQAMRLVIQHLIGTADQLAFGQFIRQPQQQQHRHHENRAQLDRQAKGIGIADMRQMPKQARRCAAKRSDGGKSLASRDHAQARSRQ